MKYEEAKYLKFQIFKNEISISVFFLRKSAVINFEHCECFQEQLNLFSFFKMNIYSISVINMINSLVSNNKMQFAF